MKTLVCNCSTAYREKKRKKIVLFCIAVELFPFLSHIHSKSNT